MKPTKNRGIALKLFNPKIPFPTLQEIYYSDRQASGKKERLDFGIAEASSLGDNLNSSFAGSSSSVPFSDVTLMCRGRSFPCHKFMLAARFGFFIVSLGYYMVA